MLGIVITGELARLAVGIWNEKVPTAPALDVLAIVEPFRSIAIFGTGRPVKKSYTMPVTVVWAPDVAMLMEIDPRFTTPLPFASAEVSVSVYTTVPDPFR